MCAAAGALCLLAGGAPQGRPIARTAPDGLVSWWRGEENASDETDANPGTEREVVGYTDGVVGRAFRFAGAGYVEVPSSPSLEPAILTVMAWVRGPVPARPGTYILSKGAFTCNGNSSYALYSVVDQVHFYGSDGGPTFTQTAASGIDVWDGVWHHVVGVYDGGFVHLYVDGQEQLPAIAAAFGAINYDLPDNRTFYIGAYFSSCKNLILNGDMDEVRFFSRALGADEVRSFYDSEKLVVALDWDEPVDTPLAPPQNLTARLVGSVAGSGAASPGAGRDSNVTGYNVYRSDTPNAPPSPATFLTSVPPTQTMVNVPGTSSGSFFVVTATYGDSESDPSNPAEAGGPGAEIAKVRVKPSRVVFKGTGFTDAVLVLVDGLPFAAPAVVKQGKRALQPSTLITGATLSQYLATKRNVEFAVINSDQTITRVPYTAR